MIDDNKVCVPIPSKTESNLFNRIKGQLICMVHTALRKKSEIQWIKIELQLELRNNCRTLVKQIQIYLSLVVVVV